MNKVERAMIAEAAVAAANAFDRQQGMFGFEQYCKIDSPLLVTTRVGQTGRNNVPGWPIATCG